MPVFRLYFLNDTSHIREAQIIEAEIATEAMRLAEIALRGRPGELWLASKKICSLPAQ